MVTKRMIDKPVDLQFNNQSVSMHKALYHGALTECSQWEEKSTNLLEEKGKTGIPVPKNRQSNK